MKSTKKTMGNAKPTPAKAKAAPAKSKAAPAKAKAAPAKPSPKPAAGRKPAQPSAKDKVLAKTPSREVSTSVADLAARDAGAGLDFGYSDVKQTVIKLLQSLSPELDTGSERYVEGAEAGDFYVSGKNELYENLDIIPIGYMHNFVEWHPRKQGGGLVGIHEHDPELVSGLERDGAVWLTEDGTEIHDTMTYFVFYLDGDGNWCPATIFMKSTNLSVGRKLNTALKNQKFRGPNGLTPAPIYMNIVSLSKYEDRNDQGRWYKFDIVDIQLMDDIELYKAARAEHDMFKRNFRDKVDFEGSSNAAASVVTDEGDEVHEAEEVTEEEFEEGEEVEELY